MEKQVLGDKARQAAMKLADDFEALIGLAPKLVTLQIVAEMTRRAGVPRSRPSVWNDAQIGRLRTVRVLENYVVTLDTEAARYVDELVAEMQNRKHRRKVPRSERKFFETREQERREQEWRGDVAA